MIERITAFYDAWFDSFYGVEKKEKFDELLSSFSAYEVQQMQQVITVLLTLYKSMSTFKEIWGSL